MQTSSDLDERHRTFKSEHAPKRDGNWYSYFEFISTMET